MKKFTTFEALLKPLSNKLIEESVRRFDTDYYTKTFTTYAHLFALIYAQLYEVKSLRDLVIAFNSQKQFRRIFGCTKITRSTLSDANYHRPARCFLWIAEQLMQQLPRKKRKELKYMIKKLDSSPIQLKGKGYDEWAFAKRTLRCQGVKLHVEYDGELEMPTRMRISHANVDDCTMGQNWPILSNTIYVFDKGYYDFNWWWSIEEKGAFFVTRLKHNVAINVTQMREALGENILEDNLFEFKNKNPRGGKKNHYIKLLRQVVVQREGKKPLVFVTNLLDVPAEVVSQLYKERWEIELFFKWVKQNLRVKKFLGKSENAVKIQLSIAIIVYLLIGLFKLLSKNSLSLHQLLIWTKHNFNQQKAHYKNIKPPDYHFTPPVPFLFNQPFGY